MYCCAALLFFVINTCYFYPSKNNNNNNNNNNKILVQDFDDITRAVEISFEYRASKNLIIVQEECAKQLSTSLLMTHNYFYTLLTACSGKLLYQSTLEFP